MSLYLLLHDLKFGGAVILPKNVCASFPIISVLFAQEPGFLGNYVLFPSLCNDHYKDCQIYSGINFYRVQFFIHFFLKEKALKYMF